MHPVPRALQPRATRRVSAACRTSRPIVQPITAGLRFFRSTRTPQAKGLLLPLRLAKPGLASGRATAPSLVESNGSSLVPKPPKPPIRYHGVHHVALICKDLDTALNFYQGILGLEVNPDRPHHKLPYRGAWLWIGPEMIHLMELDNPDPLNNRPEHGGRDRHFCIGVTDVQPLVDKLEGAGVPFTRSMSGRPAVFFRDPDMNCLEVVEQEPWR